MAPTIYGTRLSKASLAEHYDAIIIGSGISGLSTAVFLAKQGKRVLVLEQHYTAGGLTHTWRRRGYEWDTGLHYVGRVHDPNDLPRQCLDYLSDGRIEWDSLDETYDHVELPEMEFSFRRGAELLQADLLEAFPHEARGIEKYVSLLAGFSAHTKRFAISRAIPGGLARLIQPLLAGGFHRFARRTTASVLDEFFDDKTLKALLTARYENYGLPPHRSSFAVHAMTESHFLGGGNSPRGGSGQIARHLVDVLRENGGEVVVQAPVQEAITRKGRCYGVRLENGQEVLASCVISSIGALKSYEHLLGHEPGLDCARNRLGALEKSTAHVALYLGMRGTPESLALPRRNLWLHQDLDYKAATQRQALDVDAPFPMIFVGCPKQCDGSDEDARTVLELLSPMPFHHFERWNQTEWKKRGSEYNSLKDQLGARLMERAIQRFPQLQDAIEVSEVSTPLSTAKFTGNLHGQIYGVAGTPERYESPELRPQTPIRNFYMTGQDTLVPGVVGAMMSALMTSIVVCRRNLMGAIKANR